MITKAVILAKEPNTNKYTIRLPLLETAASTEPFKIDATVCCDDGVTNPFNIGDVVFVSFEDNLYDKPVILGKLSREGLLDYSERTVGASYLMKGLTVKGKTQLSDDFQLGYITYSDLFNLIQKVQNLEDKIGTKWYSHNILLSNGYNFYIISTRQSAYVLESFHVQCGIDAACIRYTDILCTEAIYRDGQLRYVVTGGQETSLGSGVTITSETINLL